MKKHLYLFVALFLVFTCSSDDDAKVQPKPTAESFAPSSGFVNDIITITGTHLNLEGTYSVKFNNLDATITQQTQTSLKVTVPQGVQSGALTLQYNNNPVIALGNFTLLSTSASNVTPNSVEIGDTITISGENFNP